MLKKFIYRKAKRFIKRVDGFSYNFEKNGEKWILDATADLNFSTIFDVGANIGNWTHNALNAHKNANIHVFELSEATFKTLQENIKSDRCMLNNIGLSDQTGEFEYKDYGSNSTVNTVLLNADYHDHKIKPAIKTAKIETGEKYCKDKKIDHIDFLKIDVEGAEDSVLRGFTSLIAAQKIRIIQFEYGYTNGDAKFLMRDFYKFFSDHGYSIGKLRNGRVDFIPWSYPLNDFTSGPNFIALHNEDKALINLLKAK